MSAVLKASSAVFRPMSDCDLPRVVEIERRSYQFPWSVGIFSDCLRVGYYCWVIDIDRVLSGYGIVAVGGGESHILNVCVDPANRRRGVGRVILEHLLAVAKEHSAHKTYLEVRPSNVSAIEMYRGLGFGHVGVRRDYYPATNGREDALVFSKRLVD